MFWNYQFLILGGGGRCDCNYYIHLRVTVVRIDLFDKEILLGVWFDLPVIPRWNSRCMTYFIGSLEEKCEANIILLERNSAVVDYEE